MTIPTLIAAVLAAPVALADPCGMVPPVWTGVGAEPTIERQGLQQTYVFYRDGVQTIAIRPGFTGTVDEFGMLVPLPSAPALRKIDDKTFTHLEAAVDPPRVEVHPYNASFAMDDSVSELASTRSTSKMASAGLELRRDEVRVVNQEAVGMYEVAVLEAGSADALSLWMAQHDYAYPNGMDRVVEDYVHSGWLFAAIKARVGSGQDTHARPGMRGVDVAKPAGARFDGYVQGMAFRFASPEPIVPMRLSTFNGSDTHNRVYMLADRPVRVVDVDGDLVRRQVGGDDLLTNLLEPLPIRVHGDADSIGVDGWTQVEAVRDPTPYNGVARDLFASDMLAVQQGSLSLPFEEHEKALLDVGESLGLRGAAIDQLVLAVVDAARDEAVSSVVYALEEMTLTVVDGELPREHLQSENLRFAGWTMPWWKNLESVWSLRPVGPTVWVPTDGGLAR